MSGARPWCGRALRQRNCTDPVRFAPSVPAGGRVGRLARVLQ